MYKKYFIGSGRLAAEKNATETHKFNQHIITYDTVVQILQSDIADRVVIIENRATRTKKFEKNFKNSVSERKKKTRQDNNCSGIFVSFH